MKKYYVTMGFCSLVSMIIGLTGCPNDTPENEDVSVGKVSLISGNLNGQNLTPSSRRISVLPGESIIGEFLVETTNVMGSNAVAPLGATITWGDRESSCWLENDWIDVGTNKYTIHVNTVAPSKAGIYYIIASFHGEYTIEQVMSCTNWTVNEPVWYDDNDVADWDVREINQANSLGYVSSWPMLGTDGYIQTQRPATCLEVLVVSEDEGMGECSLLYEDFEDGQAQGWLTNQGGSWQIVDGEYRQSSTVPNDDRTSVYAGTGAYSWTNYQAELDFRFISGTNPTNAIYISFRYQNPDNYYRVQFQNLWGQPAGGIPETFFINKMVDGELTTLHQEPIDFNTDIVNHLSIIAQGSSFNLMLNGEPLWSFTDGTHAKGTIGLASGHIEVGFDDICISPITDDECSLLFENFEENQAHDWFADQGGNWQVVDGEYQQLSTEPVEDRTSIYAGAGAYNWKDYQAELDFRYISGTNPTNAIYVSFCYQDPSNYYRIQFQNLWGQPSGGIPETFFIKKMVGGRETVLYQELFDLDTTIVNHLSINVQGSSFGVMLNGIMLHSFTDSAHTQGTIGLASGHIAVGFDNICVSPVTGDVFPGKVLLVSGTLNEQSVSPQSRHITVSPGELIVGDFLVETTNLMAPSAVAPLGAMVTWGDRKTSNWLENEWIATGTNQYLIHVNKTAPTEPGVYHIIAAFHGEYTINQVMSCTNWTVEQPVWNDNNDVVDWGSQQIDEANSLGYVRVWPMLGSDKYVSSQRPATCIEVLVAAETQNLKVTSFRINDSETTSSRLVTLYNTCEGGPTHYWASESEIFSDGSWQTYSDFPFFSITSEGDGLKTVYFKVKNAAGESAPVNDTITLQGSSGKVATPEIEPKTSSGQSSYQITLTCDTPGAIIYYTEDGNVPTPSSKLYTSPFQISGPVGTSKIVTAKAWKEGWTASDPIARTYMFSQSVATPVISAAEDTCQASYTISLECDTPGATIRYTTNDTQVTESSAKYTEPFTISGEIGKTKTIRARAWKEGYGPSKEAKKNYEFCEGGLPDLVAGAITISVGGIEIEENEYWFWLGETLQFSTTISNWGKATAPTFDWEMKVTGYDYRQNYVEQIIASGRPAYLAIDGTLKNIKGQWKPNQPGSYSVVLLVDLKNNVSAVDESDEWNNTYARRIIVDFEGPLPVGKTSE